MRYFIELAYNGTAYSGWQIQATAPSVQETIEQAFSMIFRQKIELTGCGRTDARVHASFYVAHTEILGELPAFFISRLNKVLPQDIVIYKVYPVAEDQHARFNAVYRAYEYHITFQKDPFRPNEVYYYPFPNKLDVDKLNTAARLISEYSEFYPFCKSNHDAKTLRCTIFRSEWVISPDGKGLIYHIAANRFLRGMVRLIVGMCIHVATGKISLEKVKYALDKQIRLEKDQSAPAAGLYLSEVRYEEK